MQTLLPNKTRRFYQHKNAPAFSLHIRSAFARLQCAAARRTLAHTPVHNALSMALGTHRPTARPIAPHKDGQALSQHRAGVRVHNPIRPPQRDGCGLSLTTTKTEFASVCATIAKASSTATMPVTTCGTRICGSRKCRVAFGWCTSKGKWCSSSGVATQSTKSPCATTSYGC